MSKPKVVCLCGSTRFKEAFEEVQAIETLEGCIVLSVGMFGHRVGLDMSGPVKAALDELHLRKIDMADEVFVVNPITDVCPECGKPCEEVRTPYQYVSDCCGKIANRKPYVGDSTRREIAYAESLGKPIRYLNSPH